MGKTEESLNFFLSRGGWPFGHSFKFGKLHLDLGPIDDML